MFLGKFFDAGLALAPETTRAAIEAEEAARISRALSIVLIASSIPRRLGADADDDELALDRKRARRMAHALHQSLVQWDKKAPELPLDDDLRLRGATIVWQSFGEEHLTAVRERQRVAATFAVLKDDARWGRTAIVRLANEENWISYAMRD